MQRRGFLGGVAGLAASQWAADGLDPANIEAWDPLEDGIYQTGSISPHAVSSSGGGAAASWLIEDDDLTDRTASVAYSRSGISLAVEGESDGLHAGALAELTPEQARDLAAALFQAAEEYDRRPRPE